MAHDGGGVERDTLEKVQYDFQCDDGPGALLRVVRLRMTEQVNASYELELELVTKDLGTDTDSLLGGSCQLDIGRGDHQRTVYGIIADVEYVGQTEDQLMVSVRAVPAFSLLTQQTHSRIFQDMSVQDILAEVLGAELGQYGRAFDPGSVARGTAVRDYCVQYRESDHDFCVRLMEEEGISYHFAHDDGAGKEVLTFTYANSDFPSLQNVDGSSLIPIIIDRPETAEVESIRRFEFKKSLTTTAHMWRDYDFETPLSLLEANQSGADAKGRTRRVYRHTDRRFIYDDVAARNADHLQGTQGRLEIGRGTSNATDLGVGKVFELDRHDREDLETQFLVTRVVHDGHCPEELHSTAAGLETREPRYRNAFECMPLSVPLRPARRTPKPRVYGPETGIVCGPPGEEIHVDEHGRIKVQFHWEEETTYDDTSSCWIRVRQQWSGPGWGFQFIPRIGQEVVVEFLGGDPDRPTVVGTFYNGDNRHPYPLPDHKTRSGIKTDSVSGDGSNELRFEDMSGSEEVYIHCQKDFTIATEHDKNQTTGHDETLTIANDRTKQVDHDQKETVGNDKTILVHGNHHETIVKDMDLVVQGDRSCTIGRSHEESIAESHTQSIGDSCTQTIGNAKSVNVGSVASETVGASKSIMVGASFSTTAGGAVSVSAGLSATITAMNNATLAGNKNVVVKAGSNLTQTSGKKMRIGSGDNMTIKCDKKASMNVEEELVIAVGSAKIVMKNNGDITITGANINVKGSGAVAIKGTSIDDN